MTGKITYQEWQATIEKGCPDAVMAVWGLHRDITK